MKPRVLVVSGANMDFVMKLTRIPEAGETINEYQNYEYIPGGKGCNSAVTFAKLEADSVFCTKLGNDTNGDKLLEFYNSVGIDTRFIKRDNEKNTGLAAIMIEESGQNRIVVFPGSNMTLSPDDVEEAFTCYPDALFMHFEVPVKSILTASKFAKEQDIPVFIDAGPASSEIPLEKLENVEIFSPNETETYVYTGIHPTDVEKCLKACMALEQRIRAKYIVLKLGSRGAFIYDGKFYKLIPTYDTPVVDTTAAGDSFTAALTIEYLRNGGDITRACEYANIVGSCVVSKLGASSSIPTVKELKDFMKEHDISFDL